MFLLFTAAVALSWSTDLVNAQNGVSALSDLVAKVEADLVELATVVENAFSSNKCNSSLTYERCSKGNYDSCLSEYPNQTCPAGNGAFGVPFCAGDTNAWDKCGGFFDFSVSSVSIPQYLRTGSNGEVMDTAKEVICSSLETESHMVSKFANETEFWKNNGDNHPPQVFFGSDTGVFRVHPARQSEQCGLYDPTQRPWYIAATSGPKDVVLVLDTSGSMSRLERMAQMKKAVAHVLDTLTVNDHFSIVSYNANATTLLQSSLLQATASNKEQVMEAVNNLEAGGSSDFIAAFTKAFDILEESRTNEFSSFCQTAILFLTDGDLTPAADDQTNVTEIINMRSAEIGIEPYVFFYSLGTDANDEEAAKVARKIACDTGGVWVGVDDEEDLASAMVLYHKVFAVGHNDEARNNQSEERFLAWVEPYTFFSGNVSGTTVATAVFDRSVEPNVLLGAVGIDLAMSALDAALGVESGSRKTVTRLAQLSVASCPKRRLTDCQLQTVRLASGGEQSLCTTEECNSLNATMTSAVEGCETTPEYPSDLWNNTQYANRTFSERVCCSVGETRIQGDFTFEGHQHQCLAEEKKSGIGGTLSDIIEGGVGLLDKGEDGLPIGAIGGVFVALLLCCGIGAFLNKDKLCGGGENEKQVVENTPPGSENTEVGLPIAIAPEAIPVPGEVRREQAERMESAKPMEADRHQAAPNSRFEQWGDIFD